MLIKRINLVKIDSVLLEDLIENADIKIFFMLACFSLVDLHRLKVWRSYPLTASSKFYSHRQDFLFQEENGEKENKCR